MPLIPPKRGGARPGAGKPLKDPSGKAVSKTLRFSPSHLDFVAAQQETFTQVVTMALDEFIQNHPERQKNND